MGKYVNKIQVKDQNLLYAEWLKEIVHPHKINLQGNLHILNNNNEESKSKPSKTFNILSSINTIPGSQQLFESFRKQMMSSLVEDKVTTKNPKELESKNSSIPGYNIEEKKKKKRNKNKNKNKKQNNDKDSGIINKEEKQ